jgi:hypothetical protein
MNYAAVRAVQMTSLNRQRANIVFSTLLGSDKDLRDLDLDLDQMDQDAELNPDLDPTQWTLLTPAQVARQECIFYPDGALRWSTSTTSPTPTPTWPSPQTLGSAKIGISTTSFLKTTNPSTFHKLTTLFKNEGYILFLSPKQNQKKKWHVSILLKQHSSVNDQLKAWAHGLFAARILHDNENEDILAVIAKTLFALNGRFDGYLIALGGVGWEVGIGALETGGGRRVDIEI